METLLDHFALTDLFDILLVALMLFYLYRLMRRTRSLYVFVGILIFLLVFLLVSQVFDMKLLGILFNSLTGVGLTALIVIFQEEIRHFFYDLGTNKSVKKFINRFRPEQEEKRQHKHEEIMPIVMACVNMSRQKVGALIVMEREQKVDVAPGVLIGDVIDARINQRLIENIFFKNSPLHDGAMLISGGRIKAAGCIMPVSHDYDIPKDLGLRHRSAMGISQATDAIAITVSEETGRIAAAIGGQFHLRLSAEQLENILVKGR